MTGGIRSLKVKSLLTVLAVCALCLTGCARSDAKDAYTKGCEALESGAVEESRTYFEGVLETGYFLSHAYRGIGLGYMTQGDYADACIAFEKSLLELQEESEEFQRDVSLYLAFCRDLQGQPEKTMEIYNQLIRRSPDPEVLFLRGRLNLRNGEAKAAKRDFDQAVSMSSDYDLYINIYHIYDEMDRSGDGSGYLEQALAEASRHEEEYYEQGLVNYYLQNYDEAKDFLIKAIRKNADDKNAIFLLGQVYLSLGDVANARAVYNDYTGTEGMAGGACNGLALCDIAENDYESALAHVQEGLAEDPGNQGLLYNEIVICEQMRDWNGARTKAAAYVARFPTDEAGLREYEFLSTR